MDPVRVEALRLAAGCGGDSAAIAARAVIFERYLTEGTAVTASSGEAPPATGNAEKGMHDADLASVGGDWVIGDLIAAKIRASGMSSLGGGGNEHRHGYSESAFDMTKHISRGGGRSEIEFPQLCDFLNARMPNWMALAALAEMQRHTDREAPGRWWTFVETYARNALSRFDGAVNLISVP